MARKAKKPPARRITDEQVAAFRAVALDLIALDNEQQAADDYDAHEHTLNRLYRSLTPEQFQAFAWIVRDADDPDCRCPQ